MQTMKGQFDSEEYILATPIKWSWLEESLCTSLNTSAKFCADCTAQQVGAGQGYMSVMARIHPKWTESNGSLPQSIIAKIPSLKYIPSILNDQKTPHDPCKTAEIDSIMDNLEKNLNNFHNTEVSLYAMVQDNDLHLKIPKTYVLQKFDDECAQGVIVMEDMGEQSIVFGVYHVISVDDIYQIIDQLVELHKFSFEHPECISSIGRFTLARFLRMEDQAKAFSGLVRSLRYLEEDMAPMLDHIADLWYDICDADVIDNIHNLIGMPAVLVHGDLWTANTIWREHNGKRELAAIVDWQSSHPGNAVEDIGRIISCSLTAKERRKNWRDILQYYYGKLAEKMQKHPPFLFEQLEECFIRVYPFAMCGALLAFGPVMRSDIEKRYPERREELLAVMREKMIAQTMAYDNDSDDEKRILGTSVEWSWVEEKLRCALQTESRFGANKSANRIGMGQGFVSYICRLHLDWIPKNEDLPQTVVIKIPAIDITRQLIKVMNTEGEMEKAANSDPEILLAKFEPMLRRCHNTEVSFYELVHSSGMHIKVPETYVLQKFTEHCNQGFIVMADQGTDATVLSLFNNVTPEEIMQVFDSLAEVNAYSLAHPECFANITTTSLADLFQIHDQTSMLPGMLKSVTNLDEEKLGPLTEEVEGYIKEILDPTIVSRLHEEMGMKPVLSHGDLWTANVIWKSDGERRNLAAIIDWQLAHPGTPSEDMARMMAASLSAKDRRNHLNGILEHYYNKLTELLRTEPPFTFQQLKDSFVRIYAFEMLAVAPGLGALMQTQVENLPEEEKASLLELMREKAIGLFEDIIYYYKLNKQT